MENTNKELQAEYDLLKTEYVKLLNDKDVLLNWGKPQLEALYTAKIGVFQLNKLKAQLQIMALKRKIEMVQASLNKNETPNITEIEILVAAELANAEQQIMSESNKIESAKKLLDGLDSKERASELRNLYRRFAKQLHPDANPDLTPEQIEIWHMVKAAYENGDIEKLKVLELVYETELRQLKDGVAYLTDEHLSRRKTIMSDGIRKLTEEIKNIMAQFPFTIEKLIKDDNWVAEQTQMLKAEIAQLNEYEKELRSNYSTLIK